MNLQSFIYFQPNFPVETKTDRFYLDTAAEIERVWKESGLLEVHPVVAMLSSIHLAGYYQDVVFDAGLWRTFTSACRRAYGSPVPFYTTGDEYVDSELNAADVRFLLWYFVAFTSPDHHNLSPFDSQLADLTTKIHDILERRYDEAPRPDDFDYFFRIDLEENPPAEQVYDLTRWMFWRSWLLSPVFMYYNNETALRLEKLTKEDSPEARTEIDKINIETMTTAVTGPLALKIADWVNMLLNGEFELPLRPSPGPDAPEHKYYAGFMRESGGRQLVFMPTYREMNDFLIRALGWEKGVNHLEGLKEARDFVLKIDRVKGLLIAPYIAPCIRSDENPVYNAEFARANAMELLTVKGVCPPDLRFYLIEHDMLPDARFEGSEAPLSKADADFISRCYLQEYYEGD